MSSESGEGRPAARTPQQMVTRPPESDQLPCPRCESTNTKFCYYNNYNLSQPRYFCKSCRRYWTRGGNLRNVPVGGGTRKYSTIKRSLSTPTNTNTTTSSSSSSTLTYDPKPANPLSLIPEMGHEVNLNPNETGGFISLLTTHQAPGFETFPGFGLGLGSGIRGMGFALSPWDWPMEGIGEGNGGSGGDGASGCNTWQVDGVERGGLGDGNCFG